MRKRYTTESGSQYIIEFENKTWERIRGEGAAVLRSDSGTYYSINISESIIMVCPPINPPYPRLIESTNIVKVEEI
jgi:hypothetical protein